MAILGHQKVTEDAQLSRNGTKYRALYSSIPNHSSRLIYLVLPGHIYQWCGMSALAVFIDFASCYDHRRRAPRLRKG